MPRQQCPYIEGCKVHLSRGDVNYKFSGPDTGPVVVMLHGMNASIASLGPVTSLLSSQGFRVLTYDFYGCGLSDSPCGRLDLPLYLHQLAELLDSVLFSSADVQLKVGIIGYCLGGIIASEYAQRNPQRITRVVLVAPSGLTPRSSAPCKRLLFGCLRRRIRGWCLLSCVFCLACACSVPCKRWMRSKRALDFTTPDVREPEKFMEYSQANKERCMWSLPRSVINYVRAVRSMPLWHEDSHNVYEAIASSSIPILFIWGNEDCVMALDEAWDKVISIFGSSGTSCSCFIIEGGGHGIMLEDASTVVGFAAPFLIGSQDSQWLQHLASASVATDHKVVPDAGSPGTVLLSVAPTPNCVGSPAL